MKDENKANRKQSEPALEHFSKKLVETQEVERKRIAAELHDSLAQNMLVINNEVQRILKQPNTNCRNIDSLKLISSIALQSTNEIEEIVYDLRPPQLDQLGLGKTIQWLTKRIYRVSGISFEEKIDIDREAISPEIAIHIYRIIQEALNNIVKHSLASRGIIELKGLKKHIYLRISDDGKGFKNSPRHGQNFDSFGIQGINERVKILNGTLKIDSTIGKGTKLTIKVPLKQPKSRTKK